ncbi:hybrid sensor histidine kinase/response regulator, partial [Pseudomonas fragi]
YMCAVSDTVERASKLTSQLLAFARRQPLNPQVFDVGQRVQNIGEMLESVTGARIHVQVQLPDRPCYARIDPSQFETALIN